MAKTILIGDHILKIAFQHVDRGVNFCVFDFRLEPVVPSSERKFIRAEDSLLFRERIDAAKSPELWSALKDASRDQIVVLLFNQLTKYWPGFVAFLSEANPAETDLENGVTLNGTPTEFLVEMYSTTFGITLAAVLGWKFTNSPTSNMTLVGD